MSSHSERATRESLNSTNYILVSGRLYADTYKQFLKNVRTANERTSL